MDSPFEQASQFLDQAILTYAGGQMEEASQYMASAAAVLHEIQLAPPEFKPEAAALELVRMEYPLVTVHEVPLLPAANEQPVLAVLPPVDAEPTRDSSLAVAA